MADVKHDSKRSEPQWIGEVRIAFPHHHEKRTKSAGGAPLDKPKYDATLLYPKLGPVDTCPNYKRLSDMAMEAATKAWGAWPEGGKWPIQDGDIPHPHKPKPGEKALTPEQIADRNKWRVGSWVIEVSNNFEQGPGVAVPQGGVMQDIPARVMNGVELYKSGDYGYVLTNSYTFQNKTWGVNFGYTNVAYTRSGEPIGKSGQRSTAQMFSGVPGVGPLTSMTSPGPAVGAPPLPPAAAPPLAPSAPMAPSAPVAAPSAPAYAAPPSSVPGAPPMPPLPGR